MGLRAMGPRAGRWGYGARARSYGAMGLRIRGYVAKSYGAKGKRLGAKG